MKSYLRIEKAIEVEASSYALIGDQLFKQERDNNLRLCVCETDYFSILTHAHAGARGGHFSRDTTARLILWFGLWWPTLFGDAEEYVKGCD